MNGAELLIKALKDEGVDTVFGYPGGAIIGIYDALYKEKGIRHILTAHEQGAAHAADGYARATGRVGVCLATSGPGATNLVTGIATAYMDSVPLVAITGNVSTFMLGKDSFQEVDIAGITMPVTKHNFIVKDINKLPETIYRAFEIARNGRPGPVLVDITTDVISAECPEIHVDSFKLRNYDAFSEKDLKAAAKLISKAKRPLIYAGGGAAISGAQNELLELAKKTDALFCDSLMGKGVIPGDNRRYLGMTGIHGTEVANSAVDQCDLCIACGVRFSDRAMRGRDTFAPNAEVIHIDIDPAEINKNVNVSLSLTGDVKHVLRALLPYITEKKHPAWIRSLCDNGASKPVKAPKTTQVSKAPDSAFLSKEGIVQTVYDTTKDLDAMIVAEVGAHQMAAASVYKFKAPRTLLTSGGLGTMGFGLGAAIGAKLARPAATVINLAGDGCFRMNMAELATASRYSVPIIEIIFNNRCLGLVREMQDEFCGGRHSCTDINDNVDFVKVAEGLGCKGVRVSTVKELQAALKQALKSKVPFVIDCTIKE